MSRWTQGLTSGEGSRMEIDKTGSTFVHQGKGGGAEGAVLESEDMKQLEITQWFA